MQALYNITKETLNPANAPTFVPVGINSNIKMTEVKYDVSKNGKEYLAFYFENLKGDKLSHTEWPINLPKPLEAMDETERKRWTGAIDSQMSRIKQIIETFKQNCPVISESTFKGLSEKIISFLGSSYKDVLTRVKVVYDNRGYTSLPKTHLNTFIELMSVPEELSKIRILPSDKMTRPDTRDVEKLDKNPIDLIDVTKTIAAEAVLESSVDSTSMKDDLPF